LVLSTELKLALVAETMQPGMSINYIGRRHAVVAESDVAGGG
jgi:transposase-like protein